MMPSKKKEKISNNGPQAVNDAEGGKEVRFICNDTLMVARGAISDRLDFLKHHKALDAEAETVYNKALEEITRQFDYQRGAGVGAGTIFDQ